jgi:hypothetical protein
MRKKLNEILDTSIKAQEMKAEGIFLSKLDQLEELINSTSIFEVRDIPHVRDIASILRQMLLDGERTLIHQIKRKYPFDIRFRVILPQPPHSIPNDATWWSWGGYNPDNSLQQGAATRDVDLDEFLKIIVHKNNGKEYSIKDIITYEANVDGAVHLGVPWNERHKELANSVSAAYLGVFPAFLVEIKQIASVVIKSVKPLGAKVEAACPIWKKEA